MPLVSVIIPTFNRARIIERTIGSIQRQTFTDWECLIVDDHSADNTKTVVEEYCKRDERFRYLVNERTKGAQGARNTGIKYAKSEWIQFFDSDNIMHPNCLSSFSKTIDENADIYSCFSNVINWNTLSLVSKFEWLCEGNIHDKLFTGECYVDFNSSIIRKSKLTEIGGLDEHCPSMQEWDTHLRLSKVSTYHTIPKILIDYYIGGNDAISSDSKREIIGRLYILKKHQKEWIQHKESHIAFVKDIHSLIRQHPSTSFRIKATVKLVLSAPSVQWIMLKRKMKKNIHIT